MVDGLTRAPRNIVCISTALCATSPVRLYRIIRHDNIVATIILIRHRWCSRLNVLYISNRRAFASTDRTLSGKPLKEGPRRKSGECSEILWKRRANSFPMISSRGFGVPSRRTRKAPSPQTDYESRIYFYDRPDPSALVSASKRRRSRRRRGADTELPVWFYGGASNHDTVKYIAALFIESNASENNHCLASSDREGEEGEISGLLFRSSGSRVETFIRF